MFKVRNYTKERKTINEKKVCKTNNETYGMEFPESHLQFSMYDEFKMYNFRNR